MAVSFSQAIAESTIPRAPCYSDKTSPTRFGFGHEDLAIPFGRFGHYSDSTMVIRPHYSDSAKVIQLSHSDSAKVIQQLPFGFGQSDPAAILFGLGQGDSAIPFGRFGHYSDSAIPFGRFGHGDSATLFRLGQGDSAIPFGLGQSDPTAPIRIRPK